MKLRFTKPAPGEDYLISRKSAQRVLKTLCPEFELLSFETRHGPKMSKEIAYLATLSRWEIHILSLKPEFISESLIEAFSDKILPYICRRVDTYIDSSYEWQTCIVIIDGKVYEVTCSDGMQFPSLPEVQHSIKKSPKPICSIKEK
jgi:hypothetical protein